MDDTVDLYRLLGTYRSERERNPAEPPLEAAARVLAWAGDRLDREDAGSLVIWGRSALAGDGSLHGLGLSLRTVTLIERVELPDLPKSDLAVFVAAGLVEYERDCSPELAVLADLAAGRRSRRDLTAAEYVESQTTDTITWTTSLIRDGGWIPVGIVAIVAGIVVAFISGDWSLFLLTALGGTILGYAAAIGAIITYSTVDERWLRLGQMERAWWAIFLSIGPPFRCWWPFLS